MTKLLYTFTAVLLLLPALASAASQEDADAVYSRALMLKSDGNYDKAIEVLRKEIQAHPLNLPPQPPGQDKAPPGMRPQSAAGAAPVD